MKVSEIENGSGVTVYVKRENMGVELPSEVVRVFEDCVWASPFMHDESIINFDVEGINVEMMVIKPGDVPYNFKNVQVSLIEDNGQLFHCLRTGTVGVRLNRRNAFRVFIGENGTAIEIPNGRRVRVFVKDLSSTGIGILVEKEEDIDFAVGSKIHLSFEDSLLRKEIAADGRIIRKVDQGEKVLYGCMFDKHYPAVERYAASKQTRRGINKKKKPQK